MINKILIDDIIFILRSLNIIYNLEIKNNIYELCVDLKNIDTAYINYYKIEVIPLEKDYYYGFEIDGNRRFLLGDFTVTHNTMLAIYLSWILGLKTLVVTHKEFLMDQWEERIKQFTNARVGRIRQNKIDVEDKDIVIGMLRSISTKNYSTDILHQFGLVIYDEVHHTGSRVDSQALLKTSAEYTIGLSATPDRVDGMTKIINWNVGDILYEMEKKYNYKVLVKKIYFTSSNKLFTEKKRWFKAKNGLVPDHVKMTSNLINIDSRNQLIANYIDILKSMGRKILVLSYRIEHLTTIKNIVDEKIKNDGEGHIYNSYFYVGATKRGEKRMAEKDGHIIFATMQLAEEGLDISHLDTVIFALPVNIQKQAGEKRKIISKTLIQSIGRILRNDKLDDILQIPLVVDFSDILSLYTSWSEKRDKIYIKKNWFVQNYYWTDLNYTYKHDEDKNLNPLNVVFDDITDEDFIENNLLLDINNKDTSEEKNIIVKDKPIVYGFGKKKLN